MCGPIEQLSVKLLNFPFEILNFFIIQSCKEVGSWSFYTPYGLLPA